MLTRNYTRTGFTIVELLIVIVVIGILAMITIVAYNGIQDRARVSKIEADLGQISKSTVVARINTVKTLGAITGNWYTATSCLTKPTGTDLAALPKSDDCWVDYLSALEKISDASGIDITNMTDPWGRPYAIDENEGKNTGERCIQDRLRTFKHPHVYNEPDTEYSFLVPNWLSTCKNE